MSRLQLESLFTTRQPAPVAAAPVTPKPGQRVLHSVLNAAILAVHSEADRQPRAKRDQDFAIAVAGNKFNHNHIKTNWRF